MKRKRWWIVWGLICLLCLVWLGREAWLPAIGGFLIVNDTPRFTQAIVPLAGGKERIVYASRLLNEGYADWLLVTDMPLNLPGVRQSYADLERQEALWQGVPEAKILMTNEEVTTTYAEAWSLRRLMEEQGFDSLLAVTSACHTRRAALIMRDVFRDSGIRVQVAPLADDWYQADSWWRTEQGLRETWTEYLKLILYLIGYR